MRYIKKYKLFESHIDTKIDYDDIYDIFIPVMGFGLELYTYGVSEFAAPSIGGFDGIFVKLKNIDLEGKLENGFFNEMEESINHFESKYNCKFLSFAIKTHDGRLPIGDIYSIDNLTSEVPYISDISFITLIFKF